MAGFKGLGWSQVQAPDFRDSNQLRLLGQQQILDGVGGVGAAITNYKNAGDDELTKAKELSQNRLANYLSQYNSPEERSAAMARGEWREGFGIDADHIGYSNFNDMDKLTDNQYGHSKQGTENVGLGLKNTTQEIYNDQRNFDLNKDRYNQGITEQSNYLADVYAQNSGFGGYQDRTAQHNSNALVEQENQANIARQVENATATGGTVEALNYVMNLPANMRFPVANGLVQKGLMKEEDLIALYNTDTYMPYSGSTQVQPNVYEAGNTLTGRQNQQFNTIVDNANLDKTINKMGYQQLTDIPVNDIMDQEFQSAIHNTPKNIERKEKGKSSSAIGGYQIVTSNLPALMTKVYGSNWENMNIPFDETTQRNLARQLYNDGGKNGWKNWEGLKSPKYNAMDFSNMTFEEAEPYILESESGGSGLPRSMKISNFEPKGRVAVGSTLRAPMESPQAPTETVEDNAVVEDKGTLLDQQVKATEVDNLIQEPTESGSLLLDNGKRQTTELLSNTEADTVEKPMPLSTAQQRQDTEVKRVEAIKQDVNALGELYDRYRNKTAPVSLLEKQLFAKEGLFTPYQTKKDFIDKNFNGETHGINQKMYGRPIKDNIGGNRLMRSKSDDHLNDFVESKFFEQFSRDRGQKDNMIVNEENINKFMDSMLSDTSKNSAFFESLSKNHGIPLSKMNTQGTRDDLIQSIKDYKGKDFKSIIESVNEPTKTKAETDAESTAKIEKDNETALKKNKGYAAKILEGKYTEIPFNEYNDYAKKMINETDISLKEQELLAESYNSKAMSKADLREKYVSNDGEKKSNKLTYDKRKDFDDSVEKLRDARIPENVIDTIMDRAIEGNEINSETIEAAIQNYGNGKIASFVSSVGSKKEANTNLKANLKAIEDAKATIDNLDSRLNNGDYDYNPTLKKAKSTQKVEALRTLSKLMNQNNVYFDTMTTSSKQ